ncbi:XrtA system polysaccharide chain length determinant [Undibacterium sp. SXout20W]|uniref:XrtA system polysaccharide chain length determinant n=1 Tax=Undibacterium sp. SXout20W TaxID=3413051 RepID=UPI003BEF548A
MEEMLKQIQSIFRGGWIYRWHAINIAWIISLIGFIVIFKLPDEYQSSARVFVDSQSILKPLLSNMTSVPNVDQQVSIMSRTLVSRPNVERVMRMVDMDLLASSDKNKEKLIDTLISSIKITSTTQNDIYSITYTDRSPKIAKSVVQSLLTIFVEGSIGDERQDSAKAIVFINSQIKTYEEKLATAENALKEFKMKNAGMLPREGGDFGSKLNEISDNLSQAKLEYAEAVQGRDAIKRQIASIETPQNNGEQSSPVATPELDDRIQAISKGLDNLRLQFTEDHPDIVATKRLLAQLQAKKLSEEKTRKPSIANLSNNPMYQQMKVSLTDAESKVASMRARVDEFSQRYVKAKQQTTVAPEIESQLTQLNRDYSIIKENYEKLVASRESAKISSDLNASTQMMTFRVIDPPTTPLTPMGPNRFKLFSLTFLAALVIGVSSAIALSKIRPTFHSQYELAEATGLPIIGTVGMNWTAAEQKRRKRSLQIFSVTASLLLVFYVAMMAVIYATN